MVSNLKDKENLVDISDGRLHVWRRRNERYTAYDFSPKVTFNWEKFLTDARYIEHVLNAHIVPYQPEISKN